MPDANRNRNLLLLLSLVNVVNYLDRQLVFSLFPLLKVQFSATDFQLGLLGTTFMLAHSIATVPFGVVADRASKRKLITLGMIFWCSFTFLSGLAQRFIHLIIARALIGIGGATYEPAAVPFITEGIDRSYRSRALGVVKAGMWIGGILGLILGGVLGTLAGWRNTFFLVALPGFFLALFTWNIYENPPVKREEKRDKRIFHWNILIILIIVAGSFANFSAGAFLAWITTFIVRYGYFDLPTAALIAGGTAATSGVVGIFVGSSIADRLFQKTEKGRIITVALAMVAAVPFILLGIHAPNRVLLVVAIAIGSFFMAWYHGPIMAALMDAVPPRARGAMTGIYIFFIHILGDMPSPAVIGHLSDMFNLRLAMSVTVVGNILCALTFLIAIRFGFRKNGP